MCAKQIEQLAEDDVTDITESRKIAFAGFSFLLLFVLISDSIVAIFQDLVSFFKDVSGDQVSQLLDFSIFLGISNPLSSLF